MPHLTLDQAMKIPTVRAALERAQAGDPPLLEPGQVFVFEALGKPIEQGSMTGFQDPRTGRVVMRHTDGLPEWRRTVAQACARAMRGRAPVGKHKPLLLGCEFRFDRPVAGKPGSNMALAWPTLGHDEDKLTRAVRDALTGVLYVDDGQVVGSSLNEPGTARVIAALPQLKRWTAPGECPGVVVRVLPVAVAQRVAFET